MLMEWWDWIARPDNLMYVVFGVVIAIAARWAVVEYFTPKMPDDKSLR